MNKDVMVTVSGFQINEFDENDNVELMTNGKYSKKKDRGYLRYEEVSVDTGVTKTVMIFDEHSLEVTRRGGVQLHMTFLEGQKTMTSYNTPFGNLLVGVDTDRYIYKEDENSIDIKVKYALEINHEFIADCELTTKITPRNTEATRQL